MMSASQTVGGTSAPAVVGVLLATYNGRLWIEQQVGSILAQHDVQVRLVVSDDMSSDGTWEWLVGQAASDARILLLPRGTRFGGAAKNFFRLLRDADLAGLDFVALADQDDVWLPQKLSLAVQEIKKRNISAYSGNVTAFWPDGRRALIDKAQKQRRYDYLFESAGPGCTYVLRVDALARLRAFMNARWSEVNSVALHDWFIYAWFRSNGLRWLIDSRPMLEYRQHASNQFGANRGIGAIRARIRMLRSGWYREEIRKIASLVDGGAANAPAILATRGLVPRGFLLRNFWEVRRRMRDRLFFLLTVMLGVY